MAFTLSVFATTIIVMILSVLFFPKIEIGNRIFPTYVVVTLLGALLLIATAKAGIKTVFASLTSDTAVNPLKILVLFLTMSGLSIFLDELGFFRFLANATLKRAKSGQIKLFLYLYLIVSVLTVFTSNDVIVLSFTPFICYFAKNAKINPVPYLSAEFVAANTWSMALVIGNPTNVYLATSSGIDFISYLSAMIIPTLIAGTVAFLLLLLLFYKQLKEPIICHTEEIKIKDKPLLISGIAHLSICTIVLAISSYIGLDMWLICLCFAVSLSLILLVYCLIKKEDVLIKSLKRLSYNLIPFILSMFIIVTSLDKVGIIDKIADLFDKITTNSVNTVFTYGVSSFLSCNILNNIPMSVMYEKIITSSSVLFMEEKMYSTIIASNIGAYFTPIGALAGIMWMGILNKTGIKFGFKEFLKYGVIIAPIIICVSLVTLLFIL